LAAFATTSLVGCAVDSANDSAESLGKVQMPLTVVNGDTTYRLDNATFTFVGPVNTSVSSGLETTLEVELPVGDYAVGLTDGWELVSIVGGVETVLSALLVSDNPMNFTVNGGTVSDLVFDFRVGDDVIEFGEGTARLSINVQETPNGYFDNGTWAGFAFTAADQSSTISPADFSATPSGSPFCVSGTVNPDPSYANFALLGVNLNQAEDGTIVGPAFAAGSGIEVDIDNPLGSQMMVQLVGAGTGDMWCTYTTTGGIIPWGAFRRECWTQTGAPYALEPLEQLNVVVPGNASAAIPFDFCLNDLQPVE
jgi:hypothetical protein